MSVIGLEKMLESIQKDAENKCNAILAEANAEAAQITAEYENQAEELRSNMNKDAEKQAKEYYNRAKSSVLTQKRNLFMRAEGEAVDAVFNKAKEDIRALQKSDYVSLMAGLLANTFASLVIEENNNRVLYPNEEFSDEKYEIIYSSEDKKQFGEEIYYSAMNLLKNKGFDYEDSSKLAQSKTTREIDGGFILKHGDVETNCSLSAILGEIKEELYAKVSHMLFDSEL